MSDNVKPDLTNDEDEDLTNDEDEDYVEYESDDDVINEDPTALKEESIPNEFREYITESKKNLGSFFLNFGF